jgi:transposase
MGTSGRLITDELYAKGKVILQGLSPVNRAAIRLRAIVSAKEHGVGVVAKVFDISTNTLRSWVKSFTSGQLAGLDYQTGRGRKNNITAAAQKAISQWLEEDSNLTLNALVNKLEETFGIKSSKSAVHRVLQKLKLSYITPRPVHHKQDQTVIDEFKKKSAQRNRAK